ncbi:MAG: hypothetical protein JW719_04460 [Pirellulales bacterium]|nr:hypothetical protein [Pirellulales bacterium]
MTTRLTVTHRILAWAGAAILLGGLLGAIALVNGFVRGRAAVPPRTEANDDLTPPGLNRGQHEEPDTCAPSVRPPSPEALSPTGIAPELSSVPVETSSPATPLRQAINLWNVSAAQFEANLARAVGEQLRSRRYSDGTSEYLLPGPEEQQAILRVEPTGNRVLIAGREGPAQGAIQLIHALDNPGSGDSVRFVVTSGSREDDVRRLIHAVQLDSGSRLAAGAPLAGGSRPAFLAAATQQAPEPSEPPALPSPAGPATMPGPAVEGPPASDQGTEGGRLVGPVQIHALPGWDAVIIKGRPEDVKRVQELVQQLIEYSKVTEPAIEVVMLKHADAPAIGQLLKQLHEDVYAAREGAISITPLAAPNALLLIGRKESIDKLNALVAQLDQPVPPLSRFRIFHLKHCPAEEAQESITNFFAEEAPEGAAMVPRVNVVYDFRSNALIVRACPRDMEEVAAILARLDSPDSASFNEVRVFKLKNASAEVLAPVLQDALTGQMYGQRARTGQAMGAMSSARAQDYERKSTRLQMITIGTDGQKTVNSGILTDAQVTADPRTNGLVVTASADSMPLIAALVHELDRPPTVEAQVKVFTLKNGDATNMTTMLQNIFSAAVTGEEVAVRTGVVPDETSLVELHFAVDVRTNSIIVSGSAGALVVVEAVVTHLDGTNPRERENAVYRLRNYKAADVATAVNQYLTNKRTIETSTEGVISSAEQIEREVIVVPEAASNSLIISATPRYYKEIMALIEDIDQRPPMAVIQVIIAEVTLDNFDEFGIELSLEDSLLFDRRLATGGLAIPGSLFSNGRETGGQAVTSLGTGQVNTELSYGGLVLSASSESVSALIRALSTCRRLKVLSRPQVMTLDNQSAQVIVGQKVPYIVSSDFTNFGQQNNIDYMDVGLILTVTPRITPDGFVVMELVATNSQVGPIDEGIPVSVADGQVIRSPRIDMISAQTVVSALDGQTVVLGGLIVENDDKLVRQVPVLGTIPVIGNLFKYEATTKNRSELLIIMTPRIVRNTEEAKRVACIEASRIHWCRSDVERLHGGYPGDPFFGPGHAGGPQVIYPDETPTVDAMPGAAGQVEMVPTPEGEPTTVPTGPSSQPNPASGDADAITPSLSRNVQILRPQWRVIPARSTPAPSRPEAAQPKAAGSSNGSEVSYLVQPLPAVQQNTGPQPTGPQWPYANDPVQFAGGNGAALQQQPVRPVTYYEGN